MRLLLAEDDSMLGEAISRVLRKDGFALDWARDGEEAAAALAAISYDMLLLDLGLPGRDGLDILHDLRRRGEDTPVIILTARDAVSDRITGLDSGADDYLVKPFDPDELAARIRALSRRQAGRSAPVVEYGPLSLNPSTHELYYHGVQVVLSTREFSLLSLLLERPGAVVHRERIEERLYGWNEEIGSNAVEVHIHHLRRKLSPNLIRTIRGVGYVVTVEP